MGTASGAVLRPVPWPQPPVRFGLFFAMDGQHPFEDVELNAESRAKRLFVSIEPLPDKRIYRIDERGVETYEEYVSTFLPWKLVEFHYFYLFCCYLSYLSPHVAWKIEFEYWAEFQTQILTFFLDFLFLFCSEQPNEEKLKFLAQLIHEPERPEPDTSRQTIERNLGCVFDLTHYNWHVEAFQRIFYSHLFHILW